MGGFRRPPWVCLARLWTCWGRWLLLPRVSQPFRLCGSARLDAAGTPTGPRRNSRTHPHRALPNYAAPIASGLVTLPANQSERLSFAVGANSHRPRPVPLRSRRIHGGCASGDEPGEVHRGGGGQSLGDGGALGAGSAADGPLGPRPGAGTDASRGGGACSACAGRTRRLETRRRHGGASLSGSGDCGLSGIGHGAARAPAAMAGARRAMRSVLVHRGGSSTGAGRDGKRGLRAKGPAKEDVWTD